MIAGGAAAAVVAIAVTVWHQGGTGPAADTNADASKVAMVQTTGADGNTTVMTVTAPVSTVNGTVVALVADAAGQVRQLPVVTAPPATSSSPATTAAPSSTGTAAGGVATRTPVTTTPSAGVSRATSSTASTASTRSTAPSTSSTSKADPGAVATVITGLTTLTGWEPVSTR